MLGMDYFRSFSSEEGWSKKRASPEQALKDNLYFHRVIAELRCSRDGGRFYCSAWVGRDGGAFGTNFRFYCPCRLEEKLVRIPEKRKPKQFPARRALDYR